MPGSPPLKLLVPGLRRAILLGLVGATLVHAKDVPAPEDPVVELSPITVEASPDNHNRFITMLDNLSDAMVGPFIQVRGAPLVEGIIWRHKWVKEHPLDKAIIVIDQAGDWVKSATTVYTEGEKLYASNQWLGTHHRLKQLTAEDIRDPAKVRRVLQQIRDTIYGSVKMKLDNNETDVTLGEAFVWGEETGEYEILHHNDPTGILSREFTGESNDVVLNRVYLALHNREQSGIIPVARARINFTVDNWGEKGTKDVPTDVVVFDWDGMHFAFDPTLGHGTYGKPLPKNPLTGLPYLIARNAEWMECIYFQATFAKTLPREKIVFINGTHPMVACTKQGRVHFFIPCYGQITAPAKCRIDDAAALKQIGTSILAQAQAGQDAQHPTRFAGAIPEEMPGDDVEMQVRRVFLAFQAAGIPSQLNLRVTPPQLTFTWEGVIYVYDGHSVQTKAG